MNGIRPDDGLTIQHLMRTSATVHKSELSVSQPCHCFVEFGVPLIPGACCYTCVLRRVGLCGWRTACRLVCHGFVYRVPLQWHGE